MPANGTSFSTAFTSALAALILSVDSTLIPIQVYNIITSTADKIRPSHPYFWEYPQYKFDENGWNPYLGYGRINAWHALSVASGAPHRPTNLTVGPCENPREITHPLLKWKSNTEPDFDYYNIYRSYGWELGWHYLGTTNDTLYEDMSEYYCPPGENCLDGHFVYYRVTAVDNQSKESIPSDSVETYVAGTIPYKIAVSPVLSSIPTDYSISQNYPNPFNPITFINFQIPKASYVKVELFDVLGNKVGVLLDDFKEAGFYKIKFDGTDLSSGMYFYKIEVGDYKATKKLILMK